MKNERSLLIVDDDGDLVDLVSYFLRHKDFEILRGKDGIDAFYSLLLHAPLAMLIDLRIPCITGLEVIEQIRRDPRTASIPIVAMSGDPSLLALAKDKGANAILAKPFHREDLLKVLAQHVCTVNWHHAQTPVGSTYAFEVVRSCGATSELGHKAPAPTNG